MQTYIAMLRGINVSGHKIIKMQQLRACLSSLGFRNVQTYVQSGNVIFEADEDPPARLCEKIEKCILRDFGFPVPVLLKTSQELQRIVQDNPFVKKPGIDPSKLHVTFLSKPAPKIATASLGASCNERRAVSRQRTRNLPLLSQRIRQNETFEQCHRETAKRRRHHEKLEIRQRPSGAGPANCA
jgi:uncharacterized protein (DUF1697 family)